MRWESNLENMENSQELDKEQIEKQYASIKQDIVVEKDFYTSLEEIKDSYNTLLMLEEIGENISDAKKLLEEQLTNLLSRAKKDKLITEEEVKNILGGMLKQEQIGHKNNSK